MKYNALLFCPDEKTARVVTQVLTDLEFRVEPCNEPFAAVKKLMAEHFDAIVVDCDSEQNAALLFKSAHNSGSNQSSLAVAVVEGQTGVAKAFRIGANLVLTKPINVEQSKGTLRVARGLLRKTDAAKPASATPAAHPPARPVTSIDARRPSAPQISEPRPASASLPVQPPPSPIPAVSTSLFRRGIRTRSQTGAGRSGPARIDARSANHPCRHQRISVAASFQARCGADGDCSPARSRSHRKVGG